MKKHRKIQKKQETELYVQVAEKPENQKENVGEALACFCIYVGWYLMVMQFCRASLGMVFSENRHWHLFCLEKEKFCTL